jgi:tetratricopeptide (TPR) repeat protein
MGLTRCPAPHESLAELPAAPWWCAAGVAALAVIVFAPSLAFRFTGWDDTAYIIDNPHMRDAGGLLRLWFTTESEQYYPLSFTLLWLEHLLFGEAPAGYHAISVLLHAINAVLVMRLLGRMDLAPPAAMLGAALFAVHPVQVMSVAWVAEQKNLLSCTFVLLCMRAWQHRGSAARAWYWLGVVFFIAAMLSKTAVIGLPLALAVMDRFMLRRSVALTLLRMLPLLLVSAVSAGLTIAFEQKFIAPVDLAGIPDAATRLLLTAATPWWYFGQVLLPVRLAPMYPIWDVTPADPRWWLPAAAWPVAGALLALAWRRLTPALRGWLIWSIAHVLVMLGPVLGWIPYGNMHATFVSDHFLYVALLGPVALVARGSAALWEPAGRRRLVLAGSVAVLTLAAALTLAYQPVFRDGLSLWSRSIRRAPESYAANLGLGAALELAGRPREALVSFRAAARLRPMLPDAHVLAGRLETELGEFEAAEASLRQALAADPRATPAADMLVTLLDGVGRAEEALPVLEQASAADPGNADLLVRRAQVLIRLGRHGEAEQVFRAALQRWPRLSGAIIGLATCAMARAEWSVAAATLTDGLRAAPGDIGLLNMLALVRAAAPVDAVRSGAEAVAIMEPLVAAAVRGPASAAQPLLDTLAAAYAEVGRYEDAARVADDAAKLAEAIQNDAAARESRRRASLYREGRPLRL